MVGVTYLTENKQITELFASYVDNYDLNVSII